MPVVGLDYWAILVALAGAVGILWRYTVAQNDKVTADLRSQIVALLAAVDKQDLKIGELQGALLEARVGIVAAKKVIEAETRAKRKGGG